MIDMEELENKLNHALSRIADLETAMVQTAISVKHHGKKFERLTADGYIPITRSEIARMIELSRDKYNQDG